MCSSFGDPNRKETIKSTGKQGSGGINPIPPGPRPVRKLGMQEAPMKERGGCLPGGVVAEKWDERQGQGQQVTDLRLYRQVLMNRLRGLSKTAVAMEAVGKVR